MLKDLQAKILNANDKGIKDTIIIKNLSIRLTLFLNIFENSFIINIY